MVGGRVIPAVADDRLALPLILAGATMHATWNLLIRRGSRPEIFAWMLAVAAGVLYLPIGAWRYLVAGIPPEGVPFIIATGVIHACYFAFLGRAYASGEYSLVYPVARGLGPALVPFLAVPFLGERLSALGVAGIVGVVVGVFGVSMGGFTGAALQGLRRAFRVPGTRYALLTALTIALYSTVDRAGVRSVDPVLYGWLIFVTAPLISAPYFLRAHGAAILATAQFELRSVVLAGLMAPLAYFMALIAFQMGQVSYLAPAREAGIGIAAVLGALFLGERLGRGRLSGIALLTLGIVLIALG
ncbi:MAG: hypothetical protein FJ033_05950 [Chloroflexi bacterium]|nr:hypothetical protein [Chloroflexota bacterium]